MRLVNGCQSETLPLSDRAIQFGDGVFRTIKCQAGKLFFWARHYRKLCADCTALGIPAPSEKILRSEISQLASQSGWQDAAFKIMMTRGETARGYAFPADIQPNRIVQIAPLPLYPDALYREGARLHLCQLQVSWQPALAGIKHLNRLENVLARQEWSDPAILEGVLCDREGNAVEGVMSNILMRTGNILHTPLLDSAGVAGVMREVVLAAAQRIGWSVNEQKISLQQMREAERVWICNSLLSLLPVREMAGQNWRIEAAPSPLEDEIARLEKEEMQCV